MKKIKLWLDDNVSPYFLDIILGLVIGLPTVLALLALAALACMWDGECYIVTTEFTNG